MTDLFEQEERENPDDQAEAIYQAYPRKVGKPKALAAIRKAMRTHSPAWLLSRTTLYAKTRAGEDPAYTPHPSTWFNQERFADDLGTWDEKPKEGKALAGPLPGGHYRPTVEEITPEQAKERSKEAAEVWDALKRVNPWVEELRRK